jgi:DNA-directed DNA polymerase III PolC
LNHISPCNHPESALTGSTVEAMIDRTKSLGLDYFAITDLGYLTSVLKGYMYGESEKVKIIAGVELFFKDDNCDIIRGTESEQIKYFKIIVHAKDQEAYQKIVRMCSDTTRKQITVDGNTYGAFNWSDLEILGKYNITMTTSNIECMVSKHLLVGRADNGLKYYQRLREIVGPENFYPSILPYKQDKYWSTTVKATLAGGKVVHIPAMDKIETDQKFKDTLAIELTRRGNKHKLLKAVYIDRIRFKVKDEFQEIESAKLINSFQDLPGGDIQTQANKFIIALANKFGDQDRLLINNHAFYATKEDKIVQDMKLGDEKRVYQPQYMASTDDIREYMAKELGWVDSSIEMLVQHSQKWAENFKDFKLKYNYRLPTPEGDPLELLQKQIAKVGRMKWDDERYVTQYKEELSLLTENTVINLIPYFLPIVDVYDYYKDNGFLTGPGRGSAGGFLISYLLGITHIDPIKYELSSPRFLTMDRVKQGNLPDIDCDLESRVPLVGKDGSSGYLFNKYGNKAAQVSTRTLLRIKSAILDANRFFNGGSVNQEIARLSKGLPNTPQGVDDIEYVLGYEDDQGTHHEGLLEKNDDLQKYAVERPQEWDLVKRALSLARQNSRHACAYLVADTDIEDIIPTFEVGGVRRITQPTAKQCEYAGLVKYDFLVISSLKDINLCIKYINKKNNSKGMETGHFMHKGVDTYVWDLPQDKEIYDMLTSGGTESVFQLNSAGSTPTVKKVKPTNIVDLATITSLERPGPKDFRDPKTGRNMVEEFIERKNGRSVSDIPILQELIPETFGVLVFQEQITKIAKVLGQMNVEDSENVRIAMGKKKKKLLDSLKPVFVEGASKTTDPETAEKIWSMMATFARYGFNKSHAVAYVVVSYACAFFKYHYPLEWWAAVLSNADQKEINEVFYKYVKDMVLPPDINTSTEEMEVDYNLGKIRNKLSMISGIGAKAAEKIISKRPYTDITDFTRKKVCGYAMTKKLIHVGALDSLFGEKESLLNKIAKYEKAVKQVEFEEKIKAYDEKIAEFIKEGDQKSADRTYNLKLKAIEKGPNEPYTDDFYASLTFKHKLDFLVKKSIFPTINLDLAAVLKKDSKKPIITGNKYDIIMDKWGRDVILVSGEHLQQIDGVDVTSDAKFCVPGYVMKAEEFTYQGGERKALKMIIDSSGYVSEKVLWPDYNTGQLSYPENLKEGCIAYFIYTKKPGKPYTNIYEIIVEENSIKA